MEYSESVMPSQESKSICPLKQRALVADNWPLATGFVYQATRTVSVISAGCCNI